MHVAINRVTICVQVGQSIFLPNSWEHDVMSGTRTLPETLHVPKVKTTASTCSLRSYLFQWGHSKAHMCDCNVISNFRAFAGLAVFVGVGWNRETGLTSELTANLGSKCLSGNRTGLQYRWNIHQRAKLGQKSAAFLLHACTFERSLTKGERWTQFPVDNSVVRRNQKRV